jgi:hypothetical protein
MSICNAPPGCKKNFRCALLVNFRSATHICKIGNCTSVSGTPEVHWTSGAELIVSVPHSKSGAVPMSSLSGVGWLGLWEVGKGGTVGWRVGQIGSVYKQPEKREDDSCHSWRVPSKWKGVQRGVKGGQQGEQKETGKEQRKPRRVYM